MDLGPRHRTAVGAAAALAVLLLLGACGSEEPSSADDPSSSVYGGTELEGQAPGFELVNHRGAQVALGDLRGKAVALMFFDSKCTDVCPLTARELPTVADELGPHATDTAFVAVNVNAEHRGVEDVAEFTDTHGLDDLPTWHFLTGEPEELAPVWEAYGVNVAHHADADLNHTSGLYLIDPDGEKRWYVSIPFTDEGLVEPWEGPDLPEVLSARMRELLG